MSDDRLRAAVRSEQELAMTELAFDGLKIAMVNRLIDSDFNESAEREHLYHALRALADVRKALTDAVRMGSDSKAIEAAAAEFAAGTGR
jgi:predicted component of type VI protein secretion system